MEKYAKIEDENLKICSVGLGTNDSYYKSIGMVKMDVEQAYTGTWYVKGYAPKKPAPTKEDQEQARAAEYNLYVDPITAHIQRLRDEEQTQEIIDKINALIDERKEKVEEIKAKYPYPVGDDHETESSENTDITSG